MDIFEGRRIRVKNGYWYCGKKLVHRMIWENVNGFIPKGFVIHHKDGNKLNNSIENLECISVSDHVRLHRLLNREEYSKRMSENSVKIHAWLKTDKGKKFLSDKAKKQFLDRPEHLCICFECSKEFLSKHTIPTKFCSKICMSKGRRKSGKDNESRTCEICSLTFVINKYQKTRTCSFECRNKLISRLKSK